MHTDLRSAEDTSVLATRLAAALARVGWPPLRKLELLLSEDCNLRCDYCWIPKAPRRMPWHTAKASLDYLFAESRDEVNLEVTLFGGEPLLNWSVFTRCVEYAHKRSAALGKRVHWAVTTNGTLLDEEKVHFAAQHGIAYLLSIDGVRDIHDRHRRTASGEGTFDKAIASIPLLKRAQGWLGTRMTVCPDTVGGVADSVATLCGMGINQFLIGTNQVARWERGHMQQLWEQWVAVARLYDSLRRQGVPIRITSFESPIGDFEKERRIDQWGCEAGTDKIAVTPDGSIYPCSRFADTQWLRDATRLGHISTGITAAWVRRSVCDHREIVRGKCMSCRFKAFCTGGCPATNWLVTGSPFVPTPLECYQVRMARRLRKAVPEAYKASCLPYGPPTARGFDSIFVPGLIVSVN